MPVVYSVMIRFKAELQKFGEKGEKTGWTYITVPSKIAEQIKANNKKSFRVKGKIDAHPLKAVAMIPMGGGDFIIAVNAVMRKAIRKIHGAVAELQLEEDSSPVKIATDLVECLSDDPSAKKYFNALPTSHRNWYSNWVKAAKTEITKSKRIAAVVKACAQELTFSEMMKGYREENSFRGGIR